MVMRDHGGSPRTVSDLFTLPDPLAKNLEGFAAAFSSWFLYRPARALLDAGEGIASRLGNRVYVPNVVFLTHAHFDHISGLTGFLLARTAARGDAEKPVTIYYPKAAERGFRTLQEYVNAVVRRQTYPLTWQGVGADDRIPVRHWSVRPFATRHSIPSLGYRFVETRRRLKAEHRTRSAAEIMALKKQRVEIDEPYEHTLLAFTGDTGPGLDPALFRGAEVMLHDSTFLSPDDREGLDHATAEEALAFAREAEMKNLVLYHVSHRYRRRDIQRLVPELQQKTGYAGRVTVVAGFTPPGGFY